jgi:hypothetical protein
VPITCFRIYILDPRIRACRHIIFVIQFTCRSFNIHALYTISAIALHNKIEKAKSTPRNTDIPCAYFAPRTQIVMYIICLICSRLSFVMLYLHFRAEMRWCTFMIPRTVLHYLHAILWVYLSCKCETAECVCSVTFKLQLIPYLQTQFPENWYWWTQYTSVPTRRYASKNLLRGFGPLANYADPATAASWRSSTNFCG